ncbi:MAG: class I SAM-dependent methyltransferase [Actinomycetota bacterium]|nr:class I SAM-dependent methyltransferase [Actinomycetota bacterium]
MSPPSPTSLRLTSVADGAEHLATIDGFGREWTAFDQSALTDDHLRPIFDTYFAGFPWSSLPSGATGLDIGCGSGRWARFVAPRVDRLTCVDASLQAVAVARRALVDHANVDVRHGVAGALPFGDHTFDFGYALGVLHHTPDPEAALRDCVRVLKPGAPLLVYLYYALENRSASYRLLWRASDRARHLISALPFRLRSWVSQTSAALLYWPLARTARLIGRFAPTLAEQVPLALYHDKPFYVMRNDALDRFGTRLEHRFSRDEIDAMLRRAGVDDVVFAERPPYWVAVGRARSNV